MNLIINKYSVELYEYGKRTLSKSDTVLASSEDEAIHKVKDNPFWYGEGVGYNYHRLEYPLTFKARIINEL